MSGWDNSSRRGSQCPSAGTVSADSGSWSLRDYAVALLVSLRLLPPTSRTRRWRQTGTVDSVTQANVEHQLSVKDNLLFHAAQCDDLDQLEESLKAGNCKLIFPSLKVFFEQRTAIGATAFHVALLFDSERVAKRLLELYPSFVNMPFSGKLNYGEHPLHVTVVNQNFEMVKMLVEHGAEINEPRCTGSFFRPHSGHCQVYWGEHIISFAICTGQKNIVKYLLDNGASISVCDSQQNSVLHILILQEDRKAALEMYKYLAEELNCVAHLMKHSNKQGLTPLKLAASVGNLEVFEYMMKQRRQVHWTYGPITSCIYPLEDLDTFEDDTGAVKLIVLSNAPNSVQLLEVTPIRQLLEAKWHQFGLLYFFIWMVAYISNMILLTVVVLYRPVKCSNETFADFVDILNNSGIAVDIPTCDGEAYHNSNDYIRLVGELIVLLGVVVSITLETSDLRRRGVRQYFTNVGSGLFHLISWIYAVLIFSAFIMRVTDSEHEDVCLALALVIGWMYTLFFARGFASLGPYITMIQKILRLDVGRFMIIFAVAIVSFSGALFTLVRESSPRRPDSFESMHTMAVTLFKLAIGVTDINILDYRKSPVSGWVILFFLIYITFSYLLLVELLIALMGATHQKLERERTGVWKKQLASLILLLEPRIPKRLQIRSGFPAKLFGLVDDDGWYIRVEEHGEVKKISHPIQKLLTRRKGIRRRNGMSNTTLASGVFNQTVSGTDISQQYLDTDKLISSEHTTALQPTAIVISNHFATVNEEEADGCGDYVCLTAEEQTRDRRRSLARGERVTSLEEEQFTKATEKSDDGNVAAKVHENTGFCDTMEVVSPFLSTDQEMSPALEQDRAVTEVNLETHPSVLTEDKDTSSAQDTGSMHVLGLEAASPHPAQNEQSSQARKEERSSSLLHFKTAAILFLKESKPSAKDQEMTSACQQVESTSPVLVNNQETQSRQEQAVEDSETICQSTNRLEDKRQTVANTDICADKPSDPSDLLTPSPFAADQRSSLSDHYGLSDSYRSHTHSVLSEGSPTSYDFVAEPQLNDQSSGASVQCKSAVETSHTDAEKKWWEADENDAVSVEESEM